MVRQYEVYHSLMRNAQIYVGNGAPTEKKNESDWRDYKADPLLDIVLATDVMEAVSLVAIAERIPECNLYAIEHVLNQKTSIIQTGKLYPEMFEIAGKGNGRGCMLEVWLPGDCICNFVITIGDCQSISSEGAFCKRKLLRLRNDINHEINIYLDTDGRIEGEGDEENLQIDTGLEEENENNL